MGRNQIDLDVERIKTLYYVEKKSQREIADILGCSRTVIARRMKGLGLTVRSKSDERKKRLIEVDLSEIVRLYFEKRLSAREVGKRLGMSESTVAERLKKGGYQLRKARPPRFSDKDLSEIKRLYFEQEMTLVEIAARYNCPYRTFLRHLKAQGIQLRKPRRKKREETESPQHTQNYASKTKNEWTPPAEAREVARNNPKSFDLASVPEGTIEDKILFLRDSQNAKVQDIAHTLNISPVAVYDVIMEDTQ